MARRALPALLVFTAFLCDLGGDHGAALALVLCAIPAAFVLALDCYGDALDARCTRMRPALGGVSVALLVLSAALRSPAVVGGVPHLAVSALVVTLLLYGTIGVGALTPARRLEPVRLASEARRPARSRRAA
jgi:hypothetical protein